MTTVQVKYAETFYADIDLDLFIDDFDMDYGDYLKDTAENEEDLEDTKEARIDFLKECILEEPLEIDYLFHKYGKNQDRTMSLDVRPRM